MRDDEHALLALAQTYFDAAYDMDAARFAAIFHPGGSVTRVGDDSEVNVTPIETWLAVVQTATSPRNLELARRDEVISIDIDGDLALVKLKLQMPPRYFVDLLSCLKVQGVWTIVQKVMRVEIRD